jgi:hypothetical protein
MSWFITIIWIVSGLIVFFSTVIFLAFLSNRNGIKYILLTTTVLFALLMATMSSIFIFMEAWDDEDYLTCYRTETITGPNYTISIDDEIDCDLIQKSQG